MPGLRRLLSGALLLASLTLVPSASAQSGTAESARTKPYVPIGLFFGAIEEGARLFTPVRLLPYDHPEAAHHDFPTVLQLHATEFPLLLWLGEQVGFHLWPTLERYPTEPSPVWPYAEFRPPPDSVALARARLVRRTVAEAPLPGMRAAVFDGSELVAFLVDTRGLSFAARHMTRATAMGLEINRAEFLRVVQAVAPSPDSGLLVVIWSQP